MQNKKKKGKKTLFTSYISQEQQNIALKTIIKNLQTIYKFTPQQILDLITQRPLQDIPLSIFNKKIGCLEAIVKHLKENKELSFKEISNLLQRDQRTIWSTYDKARKKLKTKLSMDSQYFIPISIISSRKYSVLESISLYMKDSLNLPFKKIAVLLKRDSRTIWTVYQRAKKKHEE